MESVHKAIYADEHTWLIILVLVFLILIPLMLISKRYVSISTCCVCFIFFHFSYTFAKLVLVLKIRYRNSDYFLSKILYSFFYCCVFNSIHTIWECVLILKISVIGYSFEIEIEKMSFKQTNELRLNRFSTLATGICTCHVNSYDCFIIFMSLS